MGSVGGLILGYESENSSRIWGRWVYKNVFSKFIFEQLHLFAKIFIVIVLVTSTRVVRYYCDNYFLLTHFYASNVTKTITVISALSKSNNKVISAENVWFSVIRSNQKLFLLLIKILWNVVAGRTTIFMTLSLHVLFPRLFYVLWTMCIKYL